LDELPVARVIEAAEQALGQVFWGQLYYSEKQPHAK
jgi:hypothetical protein